MHATYSEAFKWANRGGPSSGRSLLPIVRTLRSFQARPSRSRNTCLDALPSVLGHVNEDTLVFVTDHGRSFNGPAPRSQADARRFQRRCRDRASSERISKMVEVFLEPMLHDGLGSVVIVLAVVTACGLLQVRQRPPGGSADGRSLRNHAADSHIAPRSSPGPSLPRRRIQSN